MNRCVKMTQYSLLAAICNLFCFNAFSTTPKHEWSAIGRSTDEKAQRYLAEAAKSLEDQEAAEVAEAELQKFKYENETEVGLVSATGNTQSETLNMRHLSGFFWGLNVARLEGRFLKTESNSKETANNWRVSARYERKLTLPLGVLVGQTLESDVFSGYRQRYSSDLGARYSWSQAFDLKTGWASEAGFRHTEEKLVNNNYRSYQSGRLYNELSYAWATGINLKWFVEYLPNFTEPDDYQVNTEVSLTTILTQVFSLKVAYLIKYDHIPGTATAKTTDRLLTTSLVAKF